MSAITTHVLDTSAGIPAAGVSVQLERLEGGGWTTLALSTTDADGRARDLLANDLAAAAGTYRLRFATAEYFARRGTSALYPEVLVTFELREATSKLHLPLLLGPYSYSTYRGS